MKLCGCRCNILSHFLPFSPSVRVAVVVLVVVVAPGKS